jgi:hypothetical protein
VKEVKRTRLVFEDVDTGALLGEIPLQVLDPAFSFDYITFESRAQDKDPGSQVGGVCPS